MISDIVGFGPSSHNLSDHPDEDEEFESVTKEDDLDGAGDDTDDEEEEGEEEF